MVRMHPPPSWVSVTQNLEVFNIYIYIYIEIDSSLKCFVMHTLPPAITTINRGA